MAVALHKCHRNCPTIVMPEFKPDLQKKDSIIKVIEYRDSVRTIYITKWKKIRYTDTLPCEVLYHEVVAICDTIIVKDSLMIDALRAEVSQDSVIISKAFDVIKKDSIELSKANRKLRRQKIFTKVAFLSGLGLGGLTVMAVSH